MITPILTFILASYLPVDFSHPQTRQEVNVLCDDVKVIVGELHDKLLVEEEGKVKYSPSIILQDGRGNVSLLQDILKHEQERHPQNGYVSNLMRNVLTPPLLTKEKEVKDQYESCLKYFRVKEQQV